MPRLGASPFSFPDFRGATRLLVLRQPGGVLFLQLEETVFPRAAGEPDSVPELSALPVSARRALAARHLSFIHLGLAAAAFLRMLLSPLARVLGVHLARRQNHSESNSTNRAGHGGGGHGQGE